MLQVLSSPELPHTNGHYSCAISHAGLLYSAAILPTNTVPNHPLCTADFECQMRQLLSNFADILSAAGSAREKLISLSFYITDLSNWENLDRCVAEFFGAHKPCRSVIAVPQIRYHYAVQASFVAAL